MIVESISNCAQSEKTNNFLIPSSRSRSECRSVFGTIQFVSFFFFFFLLFLDAGGIQSPSTRIHHPGADRTHAQYPHGYLIFPQNVSYVGNFRDSKTLDASDLYTDGGYV